jgi:hypothetical protein
MPTQETQPAALAGRSAVLPVAEVVAIVREWVDLHARHLPDFAGAYLWGGITALPPDAPFHLYRDVDVVVVLAKGAQDDDQEVFYRGVSLEIISKNLEEHQDAEAVLAEPSAGPNLATTQILADPTGVLTPLHQAVAANYGRRRWVQARCAAEKLSAEEWLINMRRATTPAERMDAARVFLGALSGLLAVAQLKRPTTRRTLALLCELLEAHGRADLHEAALIVMGCAHMSHAGIQAMLEQSVIAFDRAVEVYQTPIPFSFAIRAHLRPYYLEGTLEMIDEGNHREAVFWISCLDTAYLVLQNDAPDAEKPAFTAQLQAMYAALGYTSAAAWAERVDTAERLAPEIYRIADTLVALHPEKGSICGNRSIAQA